MPNQHPERSDAEKAEALAYRRQHGNAAAQAKYRVSDTTFRRWARALGEPPLTVDPDRLRQAAHEYARDDKSIPRDEDHSYPDFLDKKLSDLDVWEALDAIDAVQAVTGKAGQGQHEARVKIDTKDPIIFVPWGDPHINSLSTDHGLFREYLQLILDTPGVYTADLGDWINNVPSNFKSAAAVQEQILPNKVAKLLMFKALEALAKKGRLIARCWSNHYELWDERVFGGSIDRVNELCPYLATDGRMFLTVGEVEYKMLLIHQLPGSSIYNPLHNNLRHVKFTWPDSDITVTAHTHDGPVFLEWIYNDLPRLAFRCSTLKLNDSYGRRHFGRSHPGLSAIVMFPDERKWITFRDIGDAITFREAYIARELKAA